MKAGRDCVLRESNTRLFLSRVQISGAGNRILDADQGDSRGVTEGGTNTSFARSVLLKQKTFVIVHPGGAS